MEKNGPDFPRYGKIPAQFSTLWKTFFHGMENSGPRRAGPGGGAGKTYFAAALRSIAAARALRRMELFLAMMPCLTALSSAEQKAR